ncbi:MAG TPA: sulfatase [Planctomycetota bacterium]|nr:sulfatase [Planctomycetota bacterium]
MASTEFVRTSSSEPAALRPGFVGEWAALALLFGTVLYVLHAAAVVSGDWLEARDPVELAAWHVGLTLELAFPTAMAFAAIATAVAIALARRPLIAVLATAPLFLAGLVGWPFEDPHHLPDPSVHHGKVALLEYGCVALGLGFLLVLACSRVRTRLPRAGLFARRGVLAAILVAAAIVPATSWALCRRTPPMRQVRERVHEFLAEPAGWTVVRSDPKAPPRVGSLTPSLDGALDGGDLPSLIMPPPCEVRFEIPRDAGRVNLRASAGVDRRLRWQLEHTPPETSISFEILVDGVSRFTASMPAHGPESVRVWHHAGGREGIPLAAGEVVTLRTSLSPPDAAVTGNIGLLAGFGRLELERSVKRPRERASAERPNLVLIVMDTLRADELSCYGKPGTTTPHLDALAARGVLYERAVAASSWTWPSTASILTGLVPETHGVVDDSACFLDDQLETLAEVLEARGYTTAGFTANPLLDPVKNFDQGFETYAYSREMRKSDEVMPGITSWLSELADARFFLYVHLVDTHEPVNPRAEDLARVGTTATPPPGCDERPTVLVRPALLHGDALTAAGVSNPDLRIPPEHQRWLRDTYSAAVSTADAYVGTVLDMLKEYDLDRNTVVAFTSDHGEELFDHGFLGHDQSLHRELVHVPLILAGPGIPRGVRVSTPVSNRHLAPTLARRGGAELPAVKDAQDLGAPDGIEPRALFFSTEHGWWWNAQGTSILGIEEWPWVLHWVPRGLAWGVARGTDPGDGQIRLYDLGTDPREMTDRSIERADLAREMLARLKEHTQTALSERRVRVRAAGDGTRALLKRFGYAGDEDDGHR